MNKKIKFGEGMMLNEILEDLEDSNYTTGEFEPDYTNSEKLDMVIERLTDNHKDIVALEIELEEVKEQLKEIKQALERLEAKP